MLRSHTLIRNTWQSLRHGLLARVCPPTNGGSGTSNAPQRHWGRLGGLATKSAAGHESTVITRREWRRYLHDADRAEETA